MACFGELALVDVLVRAPREQLRGGCLAEILERAEVRPPLNALRRFTADEPEMPRSEGEVVARAKLLVREHPIRLRAPPEDVACRLPLDLRRALVHVRVEGERELVERRLDRRAVGQLEHAEQLVIA